MADEFPFELSPMFEGERIRKDSVYIELAGPKSKGFELVRAAEMDEIEDGGFTLIGPDISEMSEGDRYPFAMIYRIAGSAVEPDLEAIVERRNHDFQNYVSGLMHLNQRYDIWLRISKDAVAKGLDSFESIAKATMMLFKNELPFIEKMDVLYITDAEEIEKRLPEVKAIYETRDARTRDLHDEDVDTFYGCTLCQSFAPTNVCVVTPDRVSLCGAINWFDGRAAAKVDPEGPQFAIDKGECLDEMGGEYAGVNESAASLSQGEYSRIKLHSFFDYPHTSCGCFEVVGFYIPELDVIAWVDRDYAQPAPNGLTFANMAGQTGGGKQIVGFLGIGINYFRSPKFIAADGGWNRVGWMPKHLKDRVVDDIPGDIVDAIATEEDATDLDSLKAFLTEKNHPIVSEWKEKEAAKKKEKKKETGAKEPGVSAALAPEVMPAGMPAMSLPAGMFGSAGSFGSGGGVRLILKNAKITIGQVIVKQDEDDD